jgi:hypothetical protein
VCWFRSRTITRWSAFAESTLTCPAVRWLDHLDVCSDLPVFPAPAPAAATANAISPATPVARTILASAFLTSKTP